MNDIAKQPSLNLTDIAKDTDPGNRRQEFATTRGVQFQRSLNSSVKREYADAPFEMTDSIRENVWWTPEEKDENGKEYKEIVNKFQHNKKLLDEEFLTLYKDCSSLSATQVLRTKTVKTTLAGLANEEGMRGLEFKLCRAASQRRKLHVRNMLSIKEMGEEVLSATSAQSSRASQILARVLAQIDYKEASRQ